MPLQKKLLEQAKDQERHKILLLGLSAEVGDMNTAVIQILNQLDNIIFKIVRKYVLA